ncbi:COP1-interacting protein 7 [Camellia lanceoleosa]|uniref:COP1-interacting protein 7 n=1 Tax=Camellia lanceoleosa TaxID=1840588 RepID=A0ACC0GGN7_9ERIC|nr:COP1-interacting protein 7 [Camellia lanceoleosa]
MDPKALLDYALFQLTPTRTRCDLVVFSGRTSEKLASGLVEPFVSHLKFAKDQIPKGGYSITLRPPTSNASWFTKSTFERFVRFVSTPEVLERFARLEKEILQIESSVQPNEFANNNAAGHADEGSLSTANGITKQSSNSSKLKGEIEGTNDAIQEENSKIRLQRLLETRKALLRKEQAMAYARALAAGFELDNIDDLILFADAFGASRLREACTEFKELYKKKHTDGLWMEELAAMEAYPPPDLSFLGTSGIILACENTVSCQNSGVSAGKLMPNGSLDASSDSTASQANSDSNKDSNVPPSDQTEVQLQMPWPNQIPPYMFNFQNGVQQMPPYQAYAFPGMQPVPPYYPGNMHWPRNIDETSHGPDQRRHQRSSSRKKDKSPNVEESKTSEEDEQIESSDSDTGTDSEAIVLHDKKHEHKKKHKKRSSKTVVIRNINYITSKKRNEEKDGVSYDSSSVEDELVDEDSIKHKVEDVVESLEKHHKSTSNNTKKRGGNKNPSFVNGSNDSADQENWNAFQNLLMSEKEESQQPSKVLDEHLTIKSSIDNRTSDNVHFVDFGLEKVQSRKTFGTDSFVVIERNEVNEGKADLEDFGNGETFRPTLKRRDSAEALLFPQRLEESKSVPVGTISYCGTESSVIKSGKGEDWFVVNHSGKSESREAIIDRTMFDGGYTLSSERDRSHVEIISKNIVPIDDSFMVQAHKSMDDQYDSHWKTDITMVSDLIVARQPENGTPDASQKKIGLSGANEPDDLCVMLGRSSEFESAGASWSPEIDYNIENSFTEAAKKSSVEANNQMEEKTLKNSKSTNGKNSVGPGTINSAKQSRSKVLQGSVAKSKLDVLSQPKKSFPTSRPTIPKSKSEKEEEARKRTEELLIQRQKRIAERTAGSGLSPAASKKVTVGHKLASPKSDKNHIVSKSDQLKKTSMKVMGIVNG